MTEVLFNRNAIKLGDQVDPLASRDIENTPGLFRASLEDAFIYGGNVTRHVLSTAPLSLEEAHITVDVKTHMLFPGMIPAIPGWHTDGAPRSNPVNGQKQAPDLFLQDIMEEAGSRCYFHLLVSGDVSQTEFYNEPLSLDIPDLPTRDLYAEIDKDMDNHLANEKASLVVPPWTWVTFDWWNLHRAVEANKFEWRYLIRITESGHIAPQRDLRKVLRQQQQVYVTEPYGW